MERIFTIPESDKDLHLYLGFLGHHGEYAVMDTIIEWLNEEEREFEYWSDRMNFESHKAIAKSFIEANKDNEKVMEYIYNNLKHE